MPSTRPPTTTRLSELVPEAAMTASVNGDLYAIALGIGSVIDTAQAQTVHEARSLALAYLAGRAAIATDLEALSDLSLMLRIADRALRQEALR